ncbi:MAG TPA: alpha/beta family hydrolase [Thermoleophilia bacterium]|nr:alpha/beta family hydrolase [Thermoleophilia bacterium]
MEVLVPTPAGEARITRLPAGGRRRATLVLGHGAGGGIDAPDLRALAAALPPGGVEVALVEQPWRVAGKRIAPQPKVLDSGWVPVVEQVRRDAEGAQRGGPGRVPIIVGGRSAGARVACRTGQAAGAVGVLALAFPLHPPGKPEKSRADELLGSGLPTLIVQGATDPFGTAAEFPELPKTHRLVALPAGNHEFAVRKDQSPVLAALVDAVAGWIDDLVGALGS